MIRRIQQLILGVAALFALGMPLLAMVPVAAQDCTGGASANIEGCLKTGACLDVTQASCGSDSDATTKINQILKTIINIFSLIVGVVAVIMIIIGGLRYILSGGDSGNITAAKNTILYAVVGLVIVALAQFIVRFVLAKVTG